MEPDALILITTIAPAKELRLRNGGPRAVRVSIEPRDAATVSGLIFEPGTVFEIAPGAEQRVRVSLDAEQFPPGLQRTVDYLCIVDGDARKQRLLHLDLRSGPLPKLLTPALDFEHVEEGKTVERPLQLMNMGSVPLRIKSVRAEGSPQLRVHGEHADRLLKRSEKLSIPIVWQTPSPQLRDRRSDRAAFASSSPIIPRSSWCR